ncbi:hypothetical protein B0O99DRAFT_650746 [Bisporella sp. PMI_857]|nr:hypothetical protein B0O99DRAFT_650746 [Bisporella sp. PMI_857]
MGTNSSSIVSKRSVERLYFPDEPHFFRYFVKKPQRRSPLINRGYWLRMKAVDVVIREFIESPSPKQKIVINLGCGYDPLPWQCLTRYPASKSVKFIDIDYRELMIKKRDVVQNTAELHSFFSNAESLQEGDILFTSDQYVQLGCDLRNIPELNQALASVIDLENSLILLTAEVSITYMKLEESDALIKWASTLPQARFCLLEQILPDGIDHPFAQTMMAHFRKLQTPLGAVERYPTTASQENRFKTLGWVNVSARNLWNLWNSSDFVTSEDRLSLNVEPFDEWEEFAIFGSHYFLLTANNTYDAPQPAIIPTLDTNGYPHSVFCSSRVRVVHSENPKGHGLRRFGAALPISISRRTIDAIGIFGGTGSTTRVNSYDLYSTNLEDLPITQSSHCNVPPPRMCHTITDLGDAGELLVGGRTSPDNALADSWVHHKYLNTWERVDDLPQPRYRHSTVCVGHGCVLVSPGRSNSNTIESEFWLWSRSRGWNMCTVEGHRPSAAYGSTFFKLSDTSDCSARGILAGGISHEAILKTSVWLWELYNSQGTKPFLRFARLQEKPKGNQIHTSIARFGATAINHSGENYVIGGIVKNDILNEAHEICVFELDTSDSSTGFSISVGAAAVAPRPLLIGTSVYSDGHSLLIMGGSAVCFSFGTFWNKGCYTIFRADTEVFNGDKPTKPVWRYKGTSNLDKVSRIANDSSSQKLSGHAVAPVPRVTVQSTEDFSRILASNKPVILEGLKLGSCIEKWKPSYLKEKIGSTREVVVHQASEEHMSFTAKNFQYSTKSFGDFIDQTEDGAKLYLRSLSSNNPSESPANVATDFPTIAPDFQLPPELNVINQGFHSSVLRISGPVNMWLHYDVMSNVLCQIQGTKRLLLFPPYDVEAFNFEPGASSSDINAFEKLRDGGLSGTHPHEAILSSSDVLFLPQLWVHTASPISGISIAINVFFRGLQPSRYAAGKDVYGNRDLQAYEKGRQDISKVIKSFEGLPPEVRQFYLTRLAQELNLAP